MSEKHRISRVTTRAGDQGETRLATGRALPKTDAVVTAMGSVDELNSGIGLLLAELADEARPPAADDRQITERLTTVQQQLFDLGAYLALEGQSPVPPFDELERWLDEWNAALPPLKEFVLPGGSRSAALAHQCRAVCRRAERDCWAVDSGADAARYLNRLSDLLFVLARTLNDPEREQQWRGLQNR